VPPGERRAALALNALYQFRLRVHTDREARQLAGLTSPWGGGAEEEDAAAAVQGRLVELHDSVASTNRGGGDSGEVDGGGDGEGSETGGEASHQHPQLPSLLPYMLQPPPPPLGLTLRDVVVRENARLTLKLTGEALNILRPLAYALAQRR
jgi:hypothetical protein